LPDSQFFYSLILFLLFQLSNSIFSHFRLNVLSVDLTFLLMSGQYFNKVINITLLIVKLIGIISLTHGFPVFFSLSVTPKFIGFSVLFSSIHLNII